MSANQSSLFDDETFLFDDSSLYIGTEDRRNAIENHIDFQKADYETRGYEGSEADRKILLERIFAELMLETPHTLPTGVWMFIDGSDKAGFFSQEHAEDVLDHITNTWPELNDILPLSIPSISAIKLSILASKQTISIRNLQGFFVLVLHFLKSQLRDNSSEIQKSLDKWVTDNVQVLYYLPGGRIGHWWATDDHAVAENRRQTEVNGILEEMRSRQAEAEFRREMRVDAVLEEMRSSQDEAEHRRQMEVHEILEDMRSRQDEAERRRETKVEAILAELRSSQDTLVDMIIQLGTRCENLDRCWG